MGRRHAPGGDAATRSSRYVKPFEFRHAAPRKGKRKLRSPLWARMCVIFGSILVVLASAVVGVQFFIQKRYDDLIARDDLLGNNRKGPGRIDGPLNFLILGTDKRTEEDYDPKDPSSRTYVTPTARADTIIWVHIPKGEKEAYVVSIPRDAMIYIPSNKDAKDPPVTWKGGKEKINAAFTFGGAPLMISALQQFTGLTIDYPLLVNFKAVRDITDAVGGIDVVVDRATTDARSKETFTAGPHHLNGKSAENFVRQRKEICPGTKRSVCSLPNGDYDRQARQQQFLFALMKKIDQKGIAKNPAKLDKLARGALKNITADKSMPTTDLLYSLKGISPARLHFVNMPMSAPEKIDGVWYEVPDEAGTQELFGAMKDETMAQYLKAHPPKDVSHGR